MRKPIKFCKNPDCEDIIEYYKSSKKEYCNDYCRNHAGYLRRGEDNEEFITYDKGMKANYNVLHPFSIKGFTRVNFQLVEKLGFDTNYLPQPKLYKIDNSKFWVYRLKEIYFGISTDNKEIIFLKKQ